MNLDCYEKNKMRSKEEIVEGLKNIISRYVIDEEKKNRYLNELTNIYPPPIRGIFSEMKKDGIEIQDKDSDLIHDAFFYFG